MGSIGFKGFAALFIVLLGMQAAFAADDLAVTSVAFSDTEASVWVPTTVTATISRSGDVAAPISYMVSFYEVEADNIVPFDNVLVNIHRQGETVTVKGEWMPEKYGTRTIRVEADSLHAIDEANETNNARSVQHTVQTAQTVLSPDCDVTADENGFVDISAIAGYYKSPDEFYCYDTTANVTVDGITYELKSFYDCRFSRITQLPVGDYNATFAARYPRDYPPRTKSCTLHVTSSSPPALVVYGLEDGGYYAINSTINLEIIGLLVGKSIRGADVSVTVFQDDKQTVVESKTAVEDNLGVYKAAITPPEEATYFVRIGMDYLHWYVEREFEIHAVPASELPGGTMQDLIITILYPREGETYDIGTNLPIQAQVEDFKGMLVTNATVYADIYDSENEHVANLTLASVRYYYKSNYTFDTAGSYYIIFRAYKDNKSATARVNFSIGSAEDINAAQHFEVRIITPASDVYLENSMLHIRARVMKKNETVRDAIVFARIGDRRYNLTYDRYGEYTAITMPLPEGEYEIRVTATQGDLIAEDSVTFMTSKHKIVATLIDPQELSEIKEGDSVPLTLEVLDETSDVVEGATVVALIVDPAGRNLESQVFLDEDGDYSTIFYPTEEGFYSIKVTAKKPGLVSAVIDAGTTVKFPEEKTFFKLDFETLFTIAVAVLVIMLLIAIFRAVF